MKNLFAFFVVFSLALSGLELVLRLVPDLLPKEIQRTTVHGPADSGLRHFWRDWRQTFVPHAVFGYRHRPKLDIELRGHPDFTYRLRTNADGYRDELESTDSPVCAVAIGDSFTFGYGVNAEDTWPEILQDYWRCPVVNLGISSYGSIRALHTLQDYGWRYRPKFVIWMFFINDAWDASKFKAWLASGHPDMRRWEREVNRSLSHRRASYLQRKLDRKLSRHLVTYSALKWMLNELANRALGRGPIARRVGDLDLVLNFKLLRKWIDITASDYIAGLVATRSALAVAQTEANTQGSRLLLLLVPPKELVYWHLLSGVDLDVSEADLLAPYRDILGACAELQLFCFDLLPPLRTEAMAGSQLYFSEDGHLTPLGNRFVANEVRQLLTP